MWRMRSLVWTLTEVGFIFTSLQTFQAHPVAESDQSKVQSQIDLSFKRLESGENSGEVVNHCCIRESNWVLLGQGIDGEVRVDIGSCRQRCSSRSPRPLKRDEFDKFLKKYPTMDPIQIFLTLQNQEVGDEFGSVNSTESVLPGDNFSRASCLFASCIPTQIRRHKHFSLSGHSQELQVIDACDCVQPPESCRRVSKMVRFHDATPYEVTVDVGQCSGPCGGAQGESQCRSIRNKTVTIEGPNGAECFPVIEECSCVGSCFRTREFHKVYDYSLVFEKEAKVNNSVVEELSPGGEVESSTEPLVKLIDLGRCEGSCRVNQGASKCLVRSNSNSTCLSSLYGGHSHCAPTKLIAHSYVDRNGQSHSLISVTSCGCQ